jgi:hypothetical protein
MGLLSNDYFGFAIGSLVVFYAIYFILHPWYLSPLKHIPGPWYAVYSKWWLVYKTLKGVRSKTIHNLHLKYGPWVRVAPNEVSTCDSNAIVPIYGVNSNFIKTVGARNCDIFLKSRKLMPSRNSTPTNSGYDLINKGAWILF